MFHLFIFINLSLKLSVSFITKISNRLQWSKWSIAATITLIALGISKFIYVYHQLKLFLLLDVPLDIVI